MPFFVTLFLQFHKPFKYIIGNRAETWILQCKFFSFYKNIFICIRETPAIRWAVIINTAEIISTKKRTGFCIHHKISFCIHTQIFFNEITFSHFQQFADTFNIRGFKPWRIIFTAIGTLQAVYFFKSFFMQIRQSLQHFIFISPLKKLFILFLVICRFFLPVL